MRQVSSVRGKRLAGPKKPRTFSYKKWAAEETRLFLSLLRSGNSTTQIREYFPDCSYRQIDHRITTLCALHDIPRPIPLRRRSKAKIEKSKRAAEPVVVARPKGVPDYSDDNLNVNDRLGRWS